MPSSAEPESSISLSTILDSLTDVVLVVDEMGRISYASNALERIFGWRRSYWVGRSALDAVHPDDAELAAARLDLVAANPEKRYGPLELRVLGSNDRWLPVEAHGFTQIDVDGVHSYVITLRDVTGRVAFEAARSAAHERTLPTAVAHITPPHFTDLVGRLLGGSDVDCALVIVVQVEDPSGPVDLASVIETLASTTEQATRRTDVVAALDSTGLLVACSEVSDARASTLAERIHQSCVTALGRQGRGSARVRTGYAVASHGDDIEAVVAFARSTEQFGRRESVSCD